MTLRIAVASPGGVVPATDSTTLRIPPEGAEGFFEHREKLSIIGSVADGGPAFAVSGHQAP